MTERLQFDLPDRECEPINDAVEIHFWPSSDPPVGTPCKCGKTTRRPPRWQRQTTEVSAEYCRNCGTRRSVGERAPDCAGPDFVPYAPR